MKAIHYKGQNKFYLFDKPENRILSLRDMNGRYERELKSNLSAGKEIVNPEVLGIKFDLFWYAPGNPIHLKLGDIFDLPDNIGFEEVDACSSDCCREPLKVIRLKLKQEAKPVEIDQPLIEIQKKEISQLKSEIDRLKSELEIQLRNGQAVKRMVHKAITERDSFKSELDKAKELLKVVSDENIMSWEYQCKIDDFLKDKR